jgi:hypothetical protein
LQRSLMAHANVLDGATARCFIPGDRHDRETVCSPRGRNRLSVNLQSAFVADVLRNAPA